MSDDLSIIEIEFKGNRRGVFANPMQLPFKLGDWAVVEVERGMDLGIISHIGLRPTETELEIPEYAIVRKASPEDLQKLQENRREEKDAMKVCQSMVNDHNLEMKLVDVEYQFDGRKLTFYFTADGRVDFRALVKDLAGHFRTRIDLRQIGARDETRKLSGYGICGLELCCTTWITEFLPITTQMPKEQNLALNPQKLSGLCGRLKCCLRYELDYYQEVLSKFPPVETEIEGFQHQGIGIIEKIDIFDHTMTIRFQDEEIEKLTYQDFKQNYYFSPGQPITKLIQKRQRQPGKQENPPA
jgi:cell fate regulator YaaT (PSP1 superfamily)